TTPKPPSSTGVTSAALVLITGWTLFAFAGAYDWTVVPLICGALLLTIRERPSVAGSPNNILDTAMIAGLVMAATTLVSLPAAVRLAIAPRAVPVDQALFFGAPS